MGDVEMSNKYGCLNLLQLTKVTTYKSKISKVDSNLLQNAIDMAVGENITLSHDKTAGIKIQVIR